MKSADILGISDRRTKQVHVPAWGTTLTIREMGLNEGVRFAGMVRETDGSATMTAEQVASVVAWSVIDEDGERVFSDEDIPKLASKSQKALLLLYSEIVGLSGSSEDAEGN
jgi:hypothetical protein